MEMESPKSTKPARNYYSTTTTPKASKKLYWPKNNEGDSPKMCGFADKQEEFGWGDSPEPLKLDSKFITGHSKKRLDCIESPISSHAKRRTSKIKPALEPKSSSNIAADNDLARIQEINRLILSTRSVNELTCTPVNATSSEQIPVSKKTSLSPSNNGELADNKSTNQSMENYFQLEDDMLLSQIDIVPETSPQPNKTKFTKSMSDNQLDSPNRTSTTGFRRSSSFQNSPDNNYATSEPQAVKKQKSFHCDFPQTQGKCSLQEIEKKRLEAKYRRESKEIERRRLEAQKRLNERRARMASNMVKPS